VRDSNGFDQFYRQTRQRVLQYVYVRSAGDLADAQDAVAEAYARAWQRWASVGTHPDPEAWVRIVAWRILANGWRKLRGRWSAYRRHGPPDAQPPISEDSVALVTALRRLPPEQRVALVLYHIAELPVAEIAVATEAPVGTVKARLSRGRQALSVLLRSTESETNHV
jgi:RNA polymerase sigma-70 factor (ECF subfamily)